MSERWVNVPCPGCGCDCDDVTLAFDKGELVAFEPRCEMGERWFRTHSQHCQSIAAMTANPPAYRRRWIERPIFLNRCSIPASGPVSESQ